jgi:NAD(P)-dependent dehydrogenase (short-subunit alcohol dehydrogenase family)
MTARFNRKTALVTGGGTGIGRAVAVALAREGATVVVAGRTPDTLAKTAELVEAAGATSDTIRADVADHDDVARLVTETVKRHGGLHIAVNNAATIGTPGPLADLDHDTWTRVLATNLTGVWLSMKYEIAHMRTGGEGTIVNVSSSIGAHMTLPMLGAYAATKAAVSTLTRTAAKENIRSGIRINAISPGPVDTPMSRFPGETTADRDTRLAEALPIGRAASTDEIAAAVAWLASPESTFVVGHDLVIDGAGTP